MFLSTKLAEFDLKKEFNVEGKKCRFTLNVKIMIMEKENKFFLHHVRKRNP